MTDQSADLFLRPSAHRTRSLLLMTMVVSIGAKALGFVRVQQIAALLGASVYADALLLTFQLVWMVEIVVIAGAVAPSLVSFVYKIEVDRGPDESARFFLHAAFWSAALSATYGLGLWLFSDLIVGLVAPGFGDQARLLTRDLLAISAIMPLCLTLSEFSSMVNRILHNGVWYSIPQLVVNSTALTGLLAGYHFGGSGSAATGMMIGLTAGSIAVVGMQLVVVPRDAALKLWRYLVQAPARPLRSADGRKLWGAVVALAFAAAVSELYVYVDFFLASTVRAGGIGLISYASRLAQLTNMLLVSTAFVILEPRWARALAELGEQAWRRLIAPDAAAMFSLLAAPVAALIFFAPEISALIYPGRAMDAGAEAQLHSLISIYGLSVVWISASLIFARMLVLRGRTRWIVAISVAVLPVKMLVSAGLSSRFGLDGLAWATIIGLALQTVGYGTMLAFSRLSLPVASALGLGVRLVALFAVVLAAAAGLSSLKSAGPWMVVPICAVLGLVNVGVGVALDFAYSENVRAFLSPTGWRNRIQRMVGRH